MISHLLNYLKKRSGAFEILKFSWNAILFKKIRPSCLILSKALEISKKTPQTLRPSMKDFYILWVIVIRWLLHESRFEAWLISDSQFVLYKKWKAFFKNKFLNFFSKNWQRWNILKEVSKFLNILICNGFQIDLPQDFYHMNAVILTVDLIWV